jgi:hypothetical protein
MDLTDGGAFPRVSLKEATTMIPGIVAERTTDGEVKLGKSLITSCLHKTRLASMGAPHPQNEHAGVQFRMVLCS